MAELDGNNLMMDWYNTYVAPRKKPIEGVFTQNKPDFGLGIPTAPRVAAAAPAQAPDVPTSVPPTGEAPANPLADYVPQQPIASPAPAEGEKASGGISPGAMGILGMGLSMAATPPRAVPYTNAEIVGRSGLAGLSIYEKALEDKRKQQALDVSEAEHRLTREDRALAARERADYWKEKVADTKERTGILKDTAESTAALREAQAEAKGRDLEPIGPNSYGIDEKMPMWKVNKLVGLQKQENAPVKPEKKDPFTTWVESLDHDPTTAEIENWHRSQGGGGADGPGKAAAITHVNRELVSQYLDKARENITAKLPAGSAELKATIDSLNSQDPLTGGPNEAKIREALNPEQRKEYDYVKRQAQKNSTKMVPAEAVAQAQADWNKENPPKKVAGGAGYDDYKRVYQSILDYKGWDNATKNAKIKALNDKARANGVIK